MQWAVWRIRKGDRTGMDRALALTLIMGVVFLVAQAFDYMTLVDQDDFGINSGIYGTLFYTMTGFHGAHVFGGVVGHLRRPVARGGRPVLSPAPRRGRGGQRLLALRRHRLDLPVPDPLLPEVGPASMFIWRNAVILGIIFVVVGVPCITSSRAADTALTRTAPVP